MSKPFFFRIESADLLNFATDPEGEGMSLLKFAKELQRGSSDIPFIQSVIDETLEFSQKKRNAANKRWSKVDVQTDAVHSGAMPEAVTEPKDKTLSDCFSKIWKDYPKKDGKKAAERHFFATVKTQKDCANISLALANYKASIAGVKLQFVKNGSTWFNNWQDWIDWKDETTPSTGAYY